MAKRQDKLRQAQQAPTSLGITEASSGSVRRATFAEFLARLEELNQVGTPCDLFTRCQFAKALGSQAVYALTYSLGDPIIRSGEPGAELCTPPQWGQTLPLDSNPLFVVTDGIVEVHRSLTVGKKNDERVTVPQVMFGPGSTFGEMELNFNGAGSGWTQYVAEATSGWRTVICCPKQENADIWECVTDKYPNSKQMQRADELLKESFRHLGCTFSTTIYLIPRGVIDSLLKVRQFTRNLISLLSDHARKHIALSVTGSGDPITKDTIPSHFASTTLRNCMDGYFPVLVPCTRIPVLRDWWRRFHRHLEDAKSVSGRNCPYVFYVPAMLPSITETTPVDTICRSPVLNKAMIRAYTRDLAMALHGSTLRPKKFLKMVRDEASGYTLELETLPLGDPRTTLWRYALEEESCEPKGAWRQKHKRSGEDLYYIAQVQE